MFKIFSQFFACLLVVVVPLQALATANMLVCNSMMQAQSHEQSNSQQVQAEPCLKHMAGMSKTAENPSQKHQSPCCKASCATLCASLNVMTMLPSAIKPATFLASTPLMCMPHQAYAAIIQPKLQRPPILLA